MSSKSKAIYVLISQKVAMHYHLNFKFKAQLSGIAPTDNLTGVKLYAKAVYGRNISLLYTFCPDFLNI